MLTISRYGISQKIKNHNNAMLECVHRVIKVHQTSYKLIIRYLQVAVMQCNNARQFPSLSSAFANNSLWFLCLTFLNIRGSCYTCCRTAAILGDGAILFESRHRKEGHIKYITFVPCFHFLPCNIMSNAILSW